jgi:hypothetical protein
MENQEYLTMARDCCTNVSMSGDMMIKVKIMELMMTDDYENDDQEEEGRPAEWQGHTSQEAAGNSHAMIDNSCIL